MDPYPSRNGTCSSDSMNSVISGDNGADPEPALSTRPPKSSSRMRTLIRSAISELLSPGARDRSNSA
ncbi:Uncharacterised protein [Mycobacteroides abscessus]|nr:Uncharacterised protein [Mycobacteroides abscessus]